MAFTARDVMTLREKSGAGMLDCKKALTDADGDMEKAADLLRERGIAKAIKKESRVAAEGCVAACVEGGTGVLFEINCESDFVSRGEKFHAILDTVGKVIAECKPADVEALLACPCGEGTVKDLVTNATFTIGEKISIRRFTIFEAEGEIETYIHMGGKSGVMVEATGCNGDYKETLHDIALQIAASRPSYLAPADVPEDVLAKEKAIQIAQMKEDPKMASKPEAVLEKIVAGKMGKFYSDNCLLEQAFVKDDSQKVKDVIGKKFSVKRFVRYEMGEGIEKKTSTLQDEIAEQVAAPAKKN